MAKKDLTAAVKESTTNTTKEITKMYISTAEPEQPRQKRKYTKYKTKENKTHLIAFRITEEQYKALNKEVDRTKSGTLTNYLNKLIEKGL